MGLFHFLDKFHLIFVIGLNGGLMSIPGLYSDGVTLLGMRRYSLGSGLGLFYMNNYNLAPERRT